MQKWMLQRLVLYIFCSIYSKAVLAEPTKSLKSDYEPISFTTMQQEIGAPSTDVSRRTVSGEQSSGDEQVAGDQGAYQRPGDCGSAVAETE
jgi:hypothetical protein